MYLIPRALFFLHPTSITKPCKCNRYCYCDLLIMCWLTKIKSFTLFIFVSFDGCMLRSPITHIAFSRVYGRCGSISTRSTKRSSEGRLVFTRRCETMWCNDVRALVVMLRWFGYDGSQGFTSAHRITCAARPIFVPRHRPSCLCLQVDSSNFWLLVPAKLPPATLLHMTYTSPSGDGVVFSSFFFIDYTCRSLVEWRFRWERMKSTGFLVDVRLVRIVLCQTFVPYAT